MGQVMASSDREFHLTCVQAYNNWLVKEFCAKDERFTFVDVVPLMLGPDGKPFAELYALDGLHLSPAGYEKWNAAVKAALK